MLRDVYEPYYCSRWIFKIFLHIQWLGLEQKFLVFLLEDARNCAES